MTHGRPSWQLSRCIPRLIRHLVTLLRTSTCGRVVWPGAWRACLRARLRWWRANSGNALALPARWLRCAGWLPGSLPSGAVCRVSTPPRVGRRQQLADGPWERGEELVRCKWIELGRHRPAASHILQGA
jgi:hypothetical protein